MKQEQLDKISLIFSLLSTWYINTGEIMRAEFYPDDGFSSVVLFTPDTDGGEGYDMQLALDDAIDWLIGIVGGD